MSAGFHLTQRVNAYQPRVQPWEWDGGYASGPRMVGIDALCMSAASFGRGDIVRARVGDATVCGVP